MLWGVLLAVGALASALAHGAGAAAWLGEPEVEPGAPAPNYRGLLRPGWLAGLAVVGLAAGATLSLVPAGVRPAWFVYCSAFAALVGIDNATTYLPLRLHYLGCAELALALAISPPGWTRGAGMLAATAITAGALWLVWRLRGGIGFGDVRLGAVTGGLSAWWGIDHWYGALLAGAVIGAVWALAVRLGPAKREWFAYGPALWLGPMVMAVATG